MLRGLVTAELVKGRDFRLCGLNKKEKAAQEAMFRLWLFDLLFILGVNMWLAFCNVDSNIKKAFTTWLVKRQDRGGMPIPTIIRGMILRWQNN